MFSLLQYSATINEKITIYTVQSIEGVKDSISWDMILQFIVYQKNILGLVCEQLALEYLKNVQNI